MCESLLKWVGLSYGISSRLLLLSAVHFDRISFSPRRILTALAYNVILAVDLEVNCIMVLFFVQVNTFEGIKAPHNTVDELTDGVALCECLAEM